MGKIILVDNSDEHINLLINVLRGGYSSFIKKYNQNVGGVVTLTEADKPVIEGYRYNNFDCVLKMDESREIGKETFINNYIKNDDVCLVDLCLTEQEECDFYDGLMSVPDYESLTGYEFAEKISTTEHVFVMSMHFFNVKLEKFMPLVGKPLFEKARNLLNKKEWGIKKAPVDNKYYITDLPDWLLTDKPHEAFCNIVFFKFFNNRLR